MAVILSKCRGSCIADLSDMDVKVRISDIALSSIAVYNIANYKLTGGIEMPRTKGSKNKKTVQKDNINNQITKQEATSQALAAEVAGIEKNIEVQKALLKDKRKELRKAEKQLTALKEKQAKAEAIEAEKAKQQEVEAIVAQLLNDGKSADEIIAAFKK